MEHVRTYCEHVETILILRIMPDTDRNYVSPNTDNRSTSAEGNLLIVCLFNRNFLKTLSFGLHTITFSFVTQYIAHNSWNSLYVVTCLNCQQLMIYLCGRRKKNKHIYPRIVLGLRKITTEIRRYCLFFIELTDCVPYLLHVPH